MRGSAGNPPRAQIPPPPPTNKAKRWARHKVAAGVRGLGLGELADSYVDETVEAYDVDETPER